MEMTIEELQEDLRAYASVEKMAIDLAKSALPNCSSTIDSAFTAALALEQEMLRQQQAAAKRIEELESVLVRAPTQQPPLPQGCTCDNDLLDLARRLSGRTIVTGREALCEIEAGWIRLLGQRDGSLHLAEERGRSRDKNAEDLRAARTLLANALSALTSLELGEQVSDFAKQLEGFLHEMHREHG